MKDFEETFDPSLTDGESAIVVESFLDEPMTDLQARTKIRSASQITSIMQNENSSEYRKTETRPKRLTVTLVRRRAIRPAMMRPWSRRSPLPTTTLVEGSSWR